jgi:hypothetical protein
MAMAEFIYKGFLISVRRAEGGAGWHATAKQQREDRDIAFDAKAEGIADLVSKIEASIHEHRSRSGDRSAGETGRSSGAAPVTVRSRRF